MPAKSGSATSTRTTKGKNKETRDSDTSEGGKKFAKRNAFLDISRPTTSSINRSRDGGGMRRIVSQSSTTNPTHRVSAIANHFNRLSRDNEKERQRKLSLFRGIGSKRAVRPVAHAMPTIQVFDNVKDAVKEDSDDDDSGASDSDGADDEDDQDVDGVDSEEEGGVRQASGLIPIRISSDQARDRLLQIESEQKKELAREQSRNVSTTSTQDTYSYDSAVGLPSEPDTLNRLPSHLLVPSIASESLPPTPVTPAFSIADSATPSINSTEVEIPPSPSLGVDHFTAPRMSEGESSGNERGSIIKAISSLWAYRGADFAPLEYPL